MKISRPFALVLILLIAATAVIAGCNDSNNGGGVVNPPVKELSSGTLNNGGVYPHTFNTAGTFPYHCNFHTSMHASVIVTSGAASNASVSITDNSFGAASVTIGMGGTVTWTNNGSHSHTVTSD